METKFDVEVLRTAVHYGMLKTLGGQGFCQTGTMSITRDKLERLIAELGGVPTSAVTATTEYLIVPNEEDFRKGSKYRAALSRGIAIITEKQFVDMILPSVDELLGDGSEGSKA